jgi:hypothetical protein
MNEGNQTADYSQVGADGLEIRVRRAFAAGPQGRRVVARQPCMGAAGRYGQRPRNHRDLATTHHPRGGHDSLAVLGSSEVLEKASFTPLGKELR